MGESYATMPKDKKPKFLRDTQHKNHKGIKMIKPSPFLKVKVVCKKCGRSKIIAPAEGCCQPDLDFLRRNTCPKCKIQMERSQEPMSALDVALDALNPNTTFEKLKDILKKF